MESFFGFIVFFIGMVFYCIEKSWLVFVCEKGMKVRGEDEYRNY